MRQVFRSLILRYAQKHNQHLFRDRKGASPYMKTIIFFSKATLLCGKLHQSRSWTKDFGGLRQRF